jgi:hypothetical protein
MELILVKVLITCALVVGDLRGFFPGSPAVFLREGHSVYVSYSRILIVVQIPSFLPRF